MKKVFLVILTVIGFMLLSGCGKGAAPQTTISGEGGAEKILSETILWENVQTESWH